MGTLHQRWLANPLDNQLLAPFVLRLLVMFGGAALLLLLVQQARRLFSHHGPATEQTASTPQRVLWQRFRTWSLIALLFVGAFFTGPFVVAVLCGFFCWQGSREYALLTGMPSQHRIILVLSGWTTCAAVLILGPASLAFAPIIAFFAWSLIALQPIEHSTEIGLRFTFGMIGLWGYLYLGWLPAYLLALRVDHMASLLLLVALGVALSDVGAFCLGKICAGPRLAPHLSPNKTWSGVLGNILGAALAFTVMAFALPHVQFWQALLLILAIAFGSVWGDLLESLLKRQCRVKDAGAFLPGFGGLLDRIDSLLLVSPLVYYIALLFLH